MTQHLPDSATPDTALLDRYLADECTPAERAAVQRWLMGDPSRRQLLAALRDGPSALAGDVWPVEDALASVRSTLPGRSEPAAVGPRSRRRWPRLVARAAAVALVVGSTLGIQLALQRSRARAPKTVVTGPAQRATITMPDGSQVTLAPSSRVTYVVATTRGVRSVRLEGQAYFRVVHDADRPFSVTTATATMVDLGTAFSVRAYRDDSTVQVAVTEGGVRVQGAATSVELSANDVGVVESSGRARRLPAANADDLLHWTHGTLAFRHARVADVLRELSRWYGRPVRTLDADIAALEFVGDLSGESLTAALDVLAASLGVTARAAGDTVVLARTRRR